jgi:hypothetical protein
MTTTNTPAPAEIIAVLQTSTAEDYKSVTLHIAPLYAVVAVRNAYRNGFAIKVSHGGNNYGVAGFTNRPSVAALKRAITSAQEYALKHFGAAAK